MKRMRSRRTRGPGIAILTLLWTSIAMLAGCGESEAAPHSGAAHAPSSAAEHTALVYLTPTCGCCADWVTHLEEAGFATEVVELPNLNATKQRYGVPMHLGSCHTAVVGDYVVEGHVPADAIARLLEEAPDVRGIAVPGMPMGSPGMEGPYTEPYDIIAFGDDGEYVFESR